jgi:hypothetical protein
VKTWADEAGLTPASKSIDRDAGEGPPRCCGRRFVAADSLICYDELAPDRLKALIVRLPHLDEASPLYLCDGCSELLIRELVFTREERAIDFGLPQEIVDKARDLDLMPAHVAALIEDRLRALVE